MAVEVLAHVQKVDYHALISVSVSGISVKISHLRLALEMAMTLILTVMNQMKTDPN